jgi:hypothetical protein
MATVSEQMRASAAACPHILADYRHRHDRAVLDTSNAGDQFVWVLGTHGSVLFPIAKGRDPVHVKFWLADGAEAFHVRITGDGGAAGEVERISYAKARKLAEIPTPKGQALWVTTGFAQIYKLEGRQIGRISNDGRFCWDAFFGPSDIWIGSCDTAEQARECVERAVNNPADVLLPSIGSAQRGRAVRPGR